MTDAAAFYDDAYASGDERHRRWRELSARGKADHVEELCRRVALEPRRTVEIGCGDGALLAELAARRFGGELAGFDVSSVAIDRARGRRVARAETFDGSRLPVADDAFDLALLSHVLEHVREPAALLREAARCASWVVVEVPLESNLSASRASKRAGAGEIGHIQRLDREAVKTLVGGAGLELEAELVDPLPREVHTFLSGRTHGSVKAAVRRAIFTVSPRVAERAFTLHYASASRRR